MDSFLFCLVLTAAIAIGGREQLIVAQFSQSLQQSWALLGVAAFCAVLTAGVMAFAGASIAAILPQRAADMLIAFSLAAAAIELAWPLPQRLRCRRQRGLAER